MQKTLSSSTRLPALIARLKDHGHRITPQRVAILQALMEDCSHPTVEQVYDTVRRQYPMTSLATVYNTVSLMMEENEALELGFGGTSRFDGARPDPHPHLICIQCQRITDLDEKDVPGYPVSPLQAHGYELIAGRVDYYGLCPDCQRLPGAQPV